MQVAVIDGMGGGIGAQLVAQLVAALGNRVEIVALGTNAWATQAMVKAGASRGATGENVVKVSAPLADIIAGPIGIVIPNAMMGEISPMIAEAIASSPARKILIPVNQGHFEIVGLESRPLQSSIRDVVQKIQELVSKGG